MRHKILISAGHSDVDPGAVAGPIHEEQLAEDLRDKIAVYLKDSGIDVITDDPEGPIDNAPLKDAIDLLDDCATGVEIHFNAGPSTASGIEALSLPMSKKLAQNLCVAVHNATGFKLRGNEGGWKPEASGQHKRLGFVRHGGIILEVCFLSNSQELKTYQDNVDVIAENIADTLLEFIRI